MPRYFTSCLNTQGTQIEFKEEKLRQKFPDIFKFDNSFECYFIHTEIVKREDVPEVC